MDLSPALREGAIRLRDAFHAFAKKKRWQPYDYRIFMDVNKVWGIYSIQLLAREYDHYSSRPRAEQRVFLEELSEFLLDYFRDDPGLYDAMNYSPGGLSDYGWSRSYSIEEPYEVIPDDFLNPGVDDFRAEFRAKHSGI